MNALLTVNAWPEDGVTNVVDDAYMLFLHIAVVNARGL